MKYRKWDSGSNYCYKMYEMEWVEQIMIGREGDSIEWQITVPARILVVNTKCDLN